MNNDWQFDYSNLYNNNANGPSANGANNTNGAAAPNASGTNAAPEAAGAPAQPSGVQTAGGAQAGPGPAMGGMPAPGVPGAPQHGRGKGGKWAKRILAGVAAVAVCAAAGFGGGYVGGIMARGASSTVVYAAPSQTTQSASANTDASDGTTAGTLSVSQIADIVAPSVVEVTTESVSTNPFFSQYVQSGAGSGVIITSDGYIITNNHVVSGAQQVTVTTHDGDEYAATVIGTDSQTDIAVLKIEADGLTPATIGDSDALVVGEYAMAVGNPMGELGGTVTDGIISGLNRSVEVEGQNMTLLQTSAAVSPGNSGGGLFNERGELIGIVNAKSIEEGADGLGFAIPINTAMSVAQSLIENGYVTGRPAFGIQVLSISTVEDALQAGVNQLGVYIVSVDEGSAAEKAGLEAGDLFVSVDGKAVTSTSDVTGALEGRSAGDTVEVQVVRDGRVVSVTVTLQEQTAAAAAG